MAVEVRPYPTREQRAEELQRAEGRRELKDAEIREMLQHTFEHDEMTRRAFRWLIDQTGYYSDPMEQDDRRLHFNNGMRKVGHKILKAIGYEGFDGHQKLYMEAYNERRRRG